MAKVIDLVSDDDWDLDLADSTDEDADAKLAEPPKKAKKAKKAKKPAKPKVEQDKPKKDAIPPLIWKGIVNTNWEYHKDVVYKFLTEKDRTIVPRIYKHFGKANFKARDKKLFLYEREVVVDKKRKQEILDKEEEKYGGQKKAYERLSRRYINLTRNEVQQFYRGSERRQLKARHQKATKIESFVHATHPGTLQIDLTFYRKHKLPVFGAVDVFSRWAYYERVPDKRASSVVVVLKKCIKAFQAM